MSRRIRCQLKSLKISTVLTNNSGGKYTVHNYGSHVEDLFPVRGKRTNAKVARLAAAAK